MSKRTEGTKYIGWYEDCGALGDLVEDNLTLMKGIAIARTAWLSNCDRITIQPQGEKDGKPFEGVSSDIGHVRVIAKGVALPRRPEVAQKTGGPMPTPARRATPR